MSVPVSTIPPTFQLPKEFFIEEHALNGFHSLWSSRAKQLKNKEHRAAFEQHINTLVKDVFAQLLTMSRTRVSADSIRAKAQAMHQELWKTAERSLKAYDAYQTARKEVAVDLKASDAQIKANCEKFLELHHEVFTLPLGSASAKDKDGKFSDARPIYRYPLSVPSFEQTLGAPAEPVQIDKKIGGIVEKVCQTNEHTELFCAKTVEIAETLRENTAELYAKGTTALQEIMKDTTARLEAASDGYSAISPHEQWMMLP